MLLPRESRRLDFAAGGKMWLDILVVVVLITVLLVLEQVLQLSGPHSESLIGSQIASLGACGCQVSFFSFLLFEWLGSFLCIFIVGSAVLASCGFVMGSDCVTNAVRFQRGCAGKHRLGSTSEALSSIDIIALKQVQINCPAP